MRQPLFVPATKNLMMAMKYLIGQVVEEMAWKVQLEDREECQDLIHTSEAFERATRREKAGRMQFAFQLKNRKEVL